PDDEGKDEEALKAEYRSIAERRVRLGLLLSDVGGKNGIEVTQDELNRALFQEAQRYPGREREVIEFFQKNPEAIANLRGPIFEDKTIDFILALAKVNERKITPDELKQELEDEAGEQPEGEGSGKKGGAKKAAKAPAKAKKAEAEPSEAAADSQEKAEGKAAAKPAGKTAGKSAAKSGGKAGGKSGGESGSESDGA